jgi:hypothetical protein
MNLSPADWKPVSGYEGFYEIHPAGQIRSIDRQTTGKHGKQSVRGKAIKPIRHKTHGYFVVNLVRNGERKQYRLHILVAQHFIPNPDNKPTVNHKWGNKSQNAADELEWATHQEQMSHAAETGLTASGERNGGNKISDLQVREAFDRCMSGEILSDVSNQLGVNRNTLPRAFKRLGFGEQWAVEALARKATARWGVPG